MEGLLNFKMAETITIPKEEYNDLMDCRKVIELEYDQQLSKELLKKLKETQQSIKQGKGTRLNSLEELEAYFDKL